MGDGQKFFRTVLGALVAFAEEPAGALHLPVRRDLAQPRDAGIAHRRARVEAAGDGAGDDRPALLGQQLQQAFLRRHQRVQPRRLPVEVVGDGALRLERVNEDRNVGKVGGVDRRVAHADGALFDFRQKGRFPQGESAVAGIEQVSPRPDHCETGGDDQVLRRFLNLCDRLKVRPHRRNDHVAIADPSAGAAWGVLEPIRCELGNAPGGIDVADVDVLHFVIRIGVLPKGVVVERGQVLEPAS